MQAGDKILTTDGKYAILLGIFVGAIYRSKFSRDTYLSNCSNSSNSSNNNSNSNNNNNSNNMPQSDKTSIKLLVIYFTVPNEDINVITDLAQSGGTILQFRLAYLSCCFDIIDHNAVKSCSNIFPRPKPIVAQNNNNNQDLLLPTQFIIDLELDMMKDKEYKHNNNSNSNNKQTESDDDAADV